MRALSTGKSLLPAGVTAIDGEFKRGDVVDVKDKVGKVNRKQVMDIVKIKMKDLNARHGAGEDQFGVNLSQLRGLAKQIKTDQELGWELWKTGNVEARLLATLIMKPKQFTVDQLDEMLRGLSYFKTVDWLMTHLVKNHPEKDKLRELLVRALA